MALPLCSPTIAILPLLCGSNQVFTAQSNTLNTIKIVSSQNYDFFLLNDNLAFLTRLYTHIHMFEKHFPIYIIYNNSVFSLLILSKFYPLKVHTQTHAHVRVAKKNQSRILNFTHPNVFFRFKKIFLLLLILLISFTLTLLMRD